jgi:hypothetical protein
MCTARTYFSDAAKPLLGYLSICHCCQFLQAGVVFLCAGRCHLFVDDWIGRRFFTPACHSPMLAVLARETENGMGVPACW